jgi:hypothetical protein
MVPTSEDTQTLLSFQYHLFTLIGKRYCVETGFRDVAPMYNTAMALVYLHLQCAVPGYKSQRMYRNKLVLSYVAAVASFHN